MIQDYQWYWLIGWLVSGIYASYSAASRRQATMLGRYKLRFHIYISSFLTFMFMILVVLSALKGGG